MSLYADIISGEWTSDDDVRKDGDTWTVCVWHVEAEIPGFASQEMAMAVVRAIREAYRFGADANGYQS